MTKAHKVSDLAKAWSTSPKMVYRLIAEGHLAAFSISSRDQAARKSGLRVSDEEKQRWERENMGAKAAPSEPPARVDTLKAICL